MMLMVEEACTLTLYKNDKGGLGVQPPIPSAMLNLSKQYKNTFRARSPKK